MMPLSVWPFLIVLVFSMILVRTASFWVRTFDGSHMDHGNALRLTVTVCMCIPSGVME